VCSPLWCANDRLIGIMAVPFAGYALQHGEAKMFSGIVSANPHPSGMGRPPLLVSTHSPAAVYPRQDGCHCRPQGPLQVRPPGPCQLLYRRAPTPATVAQQRHLGERRRARTPPICRRLRCHDRADVQAQLRPGDGRTRIHLSNSPSSRCCSVTPSCRTRPNPRLSTPGSPPHQDCQPRINGPQSM